MLWGLLHVGLVAGWKLVVRDEHRWRWQCGALCAFQVVLVINKSDLLPPAVRAEWSRYFAANGVTAVFFSALRELTQQKADAEAQFVSEADGGADDWGSSETERMGEADEGRPSKPSATDNSASVDGSNEDILSCESLVKLLIQYRDEHRAALAARQSADESEALEDFVVGTVGYPNVGKSSLINAVLGLKKVSVSQQPGKTRRLQTIPLKGRGITLCDCPGESPVGLLHLVSLASPKQTAAQRSGDLCWIVRLAYASVCRARLPQNGDIQTYFGPEWSRSC